MRTSDDNEHARSSDRGMARRAGRPRRLARRCRFGHVDGAAGRAPSGSTPTRRRGDGRAARPARRPPAPGAAGGCVPARRSRPLASNRRAELPAHGGRPLSRPGSTTRALEGYRMGRWARLALTVTVLAAVAVVTVSLTAGSAPTALVDVTVGPGDTLWSIASQAAPDRDPRAVDRGDQGRSTTAGRRAAGRNRAAGPVVRRLAQCR